MIHGILATSLIFDIDGTVWIHFILFFIVLFSLNKFLYKPYFALRERRFSETKDKILLSDIYNTGAQKLDKESEAILNKVKQEAYKERQHTRAKAVRAAERMKKEADEESDRLFYENELKLDSELQEAKENLKQQIPELAKLLAKKVLGRENDNI